MEVLRRVEKWIESWDKGEPAAANQAMQQAMTVQNKAETHRRCELTSRGRRQRTRASGSRNSPIVYLTSTPQMRVLGNLLVARWLLRHLPGAMSRAQAQPALLLRWSRRKWFATIVQLPTRAGSPARAATCRYTSK